MTDSNTLLQPLEKTKNVNDELWGSGGSQFVKNKVCQDEGDGAIGAQCACDLGTDCDDRLHTRNYLQTGRVALVSKAQFPCESAGP
jgi:hypothetical protein